MKLLLMLLFLSLTGCSSTQQAINTYGSALFQHWTHSFEDDEKNIKVYRPADYTFPPARGREGFELKEDGAYIRYAIGPTDAPEKMEGTWTMKGKDMIIVSMPKTPTPSFELKIISVEKDMLKIKQ